jgi:hypothetical protein
MVHVDAAAFQGLATQHTAEVSSGDVTPRVSFVSGGVPTTARSACSKAVQLAHATATGWSIAARMLAVDFNATSHDTSTKSQREQVLHAQLGLVRRRSEPSVPASGRHGWGCYGFRGVHHRAGAAERLWVSKRKVQHGFAPGAPAAVNGEKGSAGAGGESEADGSRDEVNASQDEADPGGTSSAQALEDAAVRFINAVTDGGEDTRDWDDEDWAALEESRPEEAAAAASAVAAWCAAAAAADAIVATAAVDRALSGVCKAQELNAEPDEDAAQVMAQPTFNLMHHYYQQWDAAFSSPAYLHHRIAGSTLGTEMARMASGSQKSGSSVGHQISRHSATGNGTAVKMRIFWRQPLSVSPSAHPGPLGRAGANATVPYSRAVLNVLWRWESLRMDQHIRHKVGSQLLTSALFRSVPLTLCGQCSVVVAAASVSGQLGSGDFLRAYTTLVRVVVDWNSQHRSARIHALLHARTRTHRDRRLAVFRNLSVKQVVKSKALVRKELQRVGRAAAQQFKQLLQLTEARCAAVSTAGWSTMPFESQVIDPTVARDFIFRVAAAHAHPEKQNCLSFLRKMEVGLLNEQKRRRELLKGVDDYEGKRDLAHSTASFLTALILSAALVFQISR